jgi:hypothetical protein
LLLKLSEPYVSYIYDYTYYRSGILYFKLNGIDVINKILELFSKRASSTARDHIIINKYGVGVFQKKLVPSDGLMFGTTWSDRNKKSTALLLQEKSVRGTISNRLKKALKNDPA